MQSRLSIDSVINGRTRVAQRQPEVFDQPKFDATVLQTNRPEVPP